MDSFETIAFYRGVSERYPTDRASLHAPLTNRRPKNSSQRFHEVADEWFLRKFRIRYRSQALFLTSKLLTATTYAATPAHVMRIIPLTEYRFCWSPRTSDLLFAAKRLETASIDAIESYLESADYRESGLRDSYDSGNEVMLFCQRYVAIPINAINQDLSQKGKIVII